MIIDINHHYPKTYTLIKELVLNGDRSIKDLQLNQKLELVRYFLIEILNKNLTNKLNEQEYDDFYEILSNHDVINLLSVYLTSRDYDHNILENFLMLVATIKEKLFNRLFEEAFEHVQHNWIEDTLTRGSKLNYAELSEIFI